MLSSRSFGISESCTNSFLVGYLYGAAERVVSLRLPRFEFKIIYTGVSLIGRVILFRGEVKNLIYQILLIFLSFYVDFLKEKEDRKLFKGFFDYREGLTKFKTLMVSGIPANILILSKDLSKQLFINDPFKNLLDDVDLDQTSWLRNIMIDKDSLGDSVKAYLGRHLDLLDSVESILEILNHKKLLKEGRIYNFNARYTNVKEKLFETKVFSLNWDGDDATVLILNDVTEHNMNLALKVADSNKDKMLAIVSHELRTPLNGILGMVSLLEKEIMHPQSLTYLSVCKSSGKMLLNIVNSILDLGQIRNNSLRLNITKDDLYKLLREICYLFKFQFDFKQLYLKLEIAPNVPQYIITDHNRLRQVLLNLIGNAMKFTFEGGVKISVKTDPNRHGDILFVVSDTGQGIKQEDLQGKLFKLYGRLDQINPQANTEGVGLGLTIADHLVRLLADCQEERHIKVDSELNKGSTFSFYIKSNLFEKEDDFEDLLNFSTRELQETPAEPVPSSSIALAQFASKSGTPLGALLQGDANNSSSGKCNFKGSQSDLSKSPLILGKAGSLLESSFSLAPSKFRPENSFKISYNKGNNKRILLVDDSPFNLIVAKHILERMGYCVETTLNGKLAIESVKIAFANDKAFLCILMDLQMPVLDGYEATKRLRSMMKDKEIPIVPIIALSANDSEDDKVKSKQVGMTDHLSKPLEEDALRRILTKITNNNIDSRDKVCDETLAHLNNK